MDSRWLWAILLLIIVVLGGWYLLASPTPTQAPTTDQTATTTPETPQPIEGAMVPAPVTVTYTDQGFDPKSVTVVQGQTVTWVNNTSNPMWIASAPHPAHTGYDGTDKDTHCAPGYTHATPFDECAPGAPGASYSFTFGKTGTWAYHDHLNHDMSGSVMVMAAPATPGINVNASTTVNVH